MFIAPTYIEWLKKKGLEDSEKNYDDYFRYCQKFENCETLYFDLCEKLGVENGLLS